MLANITFSQRLSHVTETYETDPSDIAHLDLAANDYSTERRSLETVSEGVRPSKIHYHMTDWIHTYLSITADCGMVLMQFEVCSVCYKHQATG